MVELTPRAHDALLTSQTAARRFDPEAHLRDDGELSDLAPTIIAYLGLTKPLQMTGRNICK